MKEETKGRRELFLIVYVKNGPTCKFPMHSSTVRVHTSVCFLTGPCQDHNVMGWEEVGGGGKGSDSFIPHVCSLGLHPVKVTQVPSLWVVQQGPSASALGL